MYYIFKKKVLKIISHHKYFIDQNMLCFIFLTDNCIDTEL